MKSWLSQYREGNVAGFVAISAPSAESEPGFRLIIGAAVLEFERLPPVGYVKDLLQTLQR